MADSTAFPTQREDKDINYRRISGFAVCGLLLGLLFVVFLLLQVVIGFLSHSTVLMPVWLVFMPVLGVAVSWAALRSIRNSDGTLAGNWLATGGIWLSLVGGLGYASYYGATYIAVRQQAEVAVEKWFNLLRAGKLNEAFLMTQQPDRARQVNPDDENALEVRFNAPIASGQPGSAPKPGMLDQFRDNELIYLLRQGGEATKTTPLGVRSWEEKEGTYLVRRIYAIESPETSFNLQIVTAGREDPGAPDRGRSWVIGFTESTVEKDTLKKTPLGQRLETLRADGFQFTARWGKSIYESELKRAYVQTLPLKEQVELKDKDLKKTPLPGYDATFEKGGIYDFANMRTRTPAAREVVEKALRNFLSTKVTGDIVQTFSPTFHTAKRLWSEDAEKRLILPVEARLNIGAPGEAPSYTADVIVWLRSDPGVVESSAKPSWQITKVECLNAKPTGESETPGQKNRSVRFQ